MSEPLRRRIPPWLTASAVLVVLTIIATVTPALNTLEPAAAVLPVLRFQLDSELDQRASKRDDQVAAVDAKVNQVSINGIVDYGAILSVKRQVIVGELADAESRVSANPQDAAALADRAERRGDLTAVDKEAAQTACLLSQLRGEPTTYCPSGQGG